MMTNQQREFRRLAWKVVYRLWKVDGQLRWMMECVQFGHELGGEQVDAFYERLFNLFDAIEAFKRGEIWRSVDVADSDEDDD